MRTKAVVRLEGRLGGEWVDELERCCSALLANPALVSVTIDLAEVSFIDEPGQNLLASLHHRGAQLVAKGPLSTFLIGRIQKDAALLASNIQ